MEVNGSVRICHFNRRNDHVRRDSFDYISFSKRYRLIVGTYELNLRVHDRPAPARFK